NNYKLAAKWYEKACDNKFSEEKVPFDSPDPQYYYEYASVLKSLGEYKEALRMFEFYQEKVPGNREVSQQIAFTTEAQKLIDQNVGTRYEVEKEKRLSSAQSDFSPVITEKGLVFTSTREGVIGKDNLWNGELKPDIFIAEKQKARKGGGKLSAPVLIDEEEIVNTKESEGSATFADNGKTMYFTSCNRVKNINDESVRDSNCVIMVTERKGKAWTEPKRLEFCSDSTKDINYGQPALSEDGNKLYFSSNMPGGFGGHDIWVCTYVKKTKSWSDPINLGPTVNTSRDEMFPSPYGENALYFSSNGHLGLGGLDIFVSYGRGNEWTKPKNLLYPMNSGGDDHGITFETDKQKVRALGQHGYFASNRENNRGFDDIFSFKIVPLKHTISGYVYNAQDSTVIPEAKVTLFNLTDTSDVYVMTDVNGYYFMELGEEIEYSLEPFKKDLEWKDANPTASTKGLEVSTHFDRDMYLHPMPVEFELDILYDLDSTVINAGAAKLLDSFALVLDKHYYTVMELSSHTDCRATKQYNLELSQGRAESAVNYLVSKGIDRERFVAKGYGEEKLKIKKCYCEKRTDPGYTDCTEEEHAQN
ncbi:MAG: PD40 domain-containing protein, partial [Bacteroidetes bacterium]|nr:PD40 domain-containing protein [Bacteroidota bacterium]